jgi:muramoyltetrapeptide carboxypeptidase
VGKDVLFPVELPRGGTIGVIAPASPADVTRTKKALAIISEWGFQYKLGKSVGACHGYLSGDDRIRAEDVNEMFADPEVDAIICLRGGYGTPRIIGHINYDCIGKNPKVFVGYSDITALHIAIHQATGLVTIHGPMVAELANEPDPETWPALFRLLMDPRPVGRYENMYKQTITPGRAEGRLIGGNLSLLVSTLGTPYELDTRNRILFLEDVGEEPYSLDRMLIQLKHAGKLQQARGIILADFSGSEPKSGKPSLTLEEVFTEIISPLGVPCYYGLKAGHCQPNFALPIGARVRMDASEGWLEILDGAVV